MGLARRGAWTAMGVGLAFFAGTLIPSPGRWGGVGASPLEVRGSDNVAVASYATRDGLYCLWAGGRITRLPSGQAVQAGYGGGPPGASPAARAGSGPMGAPGVAVGIVPAPEATYVLFSDGSVRRPLDPGASAPPPTGGMEALWGTVTDVGVLQESGGGVSAALQGVGPEGAVYHLTFERPFASPPSVLVTAAGLGASSLDVRVLPRRDGAAIQLLNATGQPPHRIGAFAFLVVGR